MLDKGEGSNQFLLVVKVPQYVSSKQCLFPCANKFTRVIRSFSYKNVLFVYLWVTHYSLDYSFSREYQVTNYYTHDSEYKSLLYYSGR